MLSFYGLIIFCCCLNSSECPSRALLDADPETSCSAAGQPTENGSSPDQVMGSGGSAEDYIYMWEDWVTVFCRHMQRTLNKGVPLNAR